MRGICPFDPICMMLHKQGAPPSACLAILVTWPSLLLVLKEQGKNNCTGMWDCRAYQETRTNSRLKGCQDVSVLHLPFVPVVRSQARVVYYFPVLFCLPSFSIPSFHFLFFSSLIKYIYMYIHMTFSPPMIETQSHYVDIHDRGKQRPPTTEKKVKEVTSQDVYNREGYIGI